MAQVSNRRTALSDVKYLLSTDVTPIDHQTLVISRSATHRPHSRDTDSPAPDRSRGKYCRQGLVHHNNDGYWRIGFKPTLPHSVSTRSKQQSEGGTIFLKAEKMLLRCLYRKCVELVNVLQISEFLESLVQDLL